MTTKQQMIKMADNILSCRIASIVNDSQCNIGNGPGSVIGTFDNISPGPLDYTKEERMNPWTGC